MGNPGLNDLSDFSGPPQTDRGQRTRLGKFRKASMIVAARRYLAAFAVTAVLALGLGGCGGGGGPRRLAGVE